MKHDFQTQILMYNNNHTKLSNLAEEKKHNIIQILSKNYNNYLFSLKLNKKKK